VFVYEPNVLSSIPRRKVGNHSVHHHAQKCIVSYKRKVPRDLERDKFCRSVKLIVILHLINFHLDKVSRLTPHPTTPSLSDIHYDPY
jgi:hypothetical protein